MAQTLARALFRAAPKRHLRTRAAEAVRVLIEITVADTTAAGRWHWKPIGG